MDNLLNTIGMAKKAGRLVVGDEPVGAAARGRQARLLIVASDAAENTMRRVTNLSEHNHMPWVQIPATKGELGMAVGRTSCAIVAMTDAGFAASFAKKLAVHQPEELTEVAQQLDEKATRIQARQKEKRQHEKKLARMQAKPWAKK